MNLDEFGIFVKERRQELGYSVEGFAGRVHCSPSFIRSIERGAQRPSRVMGQTLLSRLNVSCRVADPFTLELRDGRMILFTAATKGHNGLGAVAKRNIDEIKELKAKVSDLEARLKRLEDKDGR